MTTIQDLDTTETIRATQPMTARQRRFTIVFGIFALVTIVAFLLVALQANVMISVFTDSVAHNLLHG